MKLAIIGAMDLEVDALRAALTDEKITTVAGMKFSEGKLDGADVVIVRCGIGKVNAGMCVQILMWLGRAAAACLLGFAPAACIGFITTDILSGLFTLVIVWVSRRVEGLFEDQKNYLLRIQKEQQVERGEPF